MAAREHLLLCLLVVLLFRRRKERKKEESKMFWEKDSRGVLESSERTASVLLQCVDVVERFFQIF